uniref:FTP domain-containing protein n=1 Tax=Panagrellus redivivus TaxID=6233 RepID=A0A7E4W1M4_PANRE
MLSIYIVLLLSIVSYVFACMPVSAPDGVIPVEMVPTTVTALTTIPAETGSSLTTTMTTTLTTTTPLTTTTIPARTCAESDSMPSLFVATGTSFIDLTYGDVSPSSSCSTCDGGTVNYYPSASEAMPQWGEEAIGTIFAEACPNLCMCDTSGTCWRLTGLEVTTIFFWQYCTGGTCGVYPVIGTSFDEAGIVTQDGSRTITANDQLDPDTFDFYPVTNTEAYPDLASVGCDSCPTYTCKTTSA